MYYPGQPPPAPVVPFAVPVEGGVRTGKMVIIRGTIPSGAETFTINLQSGQTLADDPRPETSLHMSVRFNENCVVRNSYQYGKWGKEERAGGMPLHRHQSFELTILMDSRCYKIAINGRHFTDFDYKMAKEVGSFIRVDGHIHIDSLKVEGGGSGDASYQPPGPYGPPIFHQPAVPFETKIGPLSPGRMVYLNGTPRYGAGRFSINLQCGLHYEADIALHFDVRFQHDSDSNVVVRNHRHGATWGSEDRRGYFPFIPNQTFEVIIMAEAHQFRIAVNNVHFTEFRHRIPHLMCVDSLTVTGDVTLNKVRVQ